MASTSCVMVTIFSIIFGLVLINTISDTPYENETDKAKQLEGLSLFRWPLLLIYSGLMLSFIATVLIEIMSMSNIVLIGFTGIGLIGFGIFRLINVYHLRATTEEKKKNEDFGTF